MPVSDERLIAWANQQMDDILSQPKQCGGLEYVEGRFCALLEALVAARFSDQRSFQAIQDVVSAAYARVRRRHLPMVGSAVAFWSVCGFREDDRGRLVPGEHAYDNLVALLKALRYEVG